MIPATEMRAIVQTAALPIHDPLSLVERIVPRPDPGPHDLLVEVRAVSVNPADVKLRAESSPDDAGRILGFDASGIVREVGDAVTLFAPGDEVFYAGAIDRPGSNAEMQLVDERIVGHRPRTLSHTDAAALPLTSLTAAEGLLDKLRIDADATGTLLVVGGAGGVGSMTIQLARTLFPGIRVIATASRDDSAVWVRELGAHDVVDHHGDLAVQVHHLVPDGVDWIFTTHSAEQLPIYEQILRPFGQIVAIDDPAVLDVVALKSKALTWHWEFMFARSMHQAPDLQRQHQILQQIAELVDEGRLRATATTVLRPITAATVREAHALLESGHVTGKVVITNDPA